MADANIFAQYLRPMKTVADYQAEGDAADLRRQQLIGAQRQNALASLVAQQQQQTMAETAADNERVRQAYADAGGDQNRLLSILRGPTATKGTVSHADAVEAAMLKRRETVAKAGEEEGKTTDAALKRYSGMLGTYVKDPQTAALWYQAQYTDPVIGKMMQQVHGPLDQVVGQIPQDPQGFARWVQQTRDGMTKYAEAVAPKPTEVKLGNRVAFIDTNPQSPTFRQELTSSTIGTSPDTVYTQGQENYRQGVRLKQEKELAGQGGSVIDTDQGKMWVPNKPQPGSVIRATPVIGPTGLQPLQGKPSESVQKEQLSINQQRAMIDGAIKAAKDTPSAFGFGRGLATMAGSIPESLAGRVDDDSERQARSFVFNNVSAVINERAGAAQTPAELARLRSFLPAETDNSDQVISKMNAFLSYLAEKERGTTTARPTAKPEPQPPQASGAFKILGSK